ncbi:hypothetical protein [Yersinia phage MHG19]|nr:hypothetical protein [Yersinia phage MHG19]
MNKFEENKWYQLVDEDGFVDHVFGNGSMAQLIKENGIFLVTETTNRGSALVVKFVTGLVGTYNCRDGSLWFHLGPSERQFFEEVLPPHAGYRTTQGEPIELDTPLAELNLVINAANAARSINIIKAAFL